MQIQYTDRYRGEGLTSAPINNIGTGPVHFVQGKRELQVGATCI